MARALAEGPAQSIFTALLDELTDGRQAGAATVLVVEDVHWADDASLDALAFVARRIEGLRALLVLTYRDDEVPVVSLLQRVLGGLRAPVAVRIPLGPLSARAVTQLAGEPGCGPARATHPPAATRSSSPSCSPPSRRGCPPR